MSSIAEFPTGINAERIGEHNIRGANGARLNNQLAMRSGDGTQPTATTNGRQIAEPGAQGIARSVAVSGTGTACGGAARAQAMIDAAHRAACDQAVAHHWQTMAPYEVDAQVLREALDPSKSLEQRLDEALDRAVAEYFDEHRTMPRPGTQLRDPVTRCSVTYEPRAQIEINRILQQEHDRQQQHVEARNARLQPVCDADFAAGDYRHNYLIQSVLIEGQPMMISGIKKALKTSTIVDMAASLASGKPFLGHHKFQVPQAVTVGVYSGESGKATIQDT
ncbi:MAG: AAA family ATPase, partial [Thermoguttaceae bacterium]